VLKAVAILRLTRKPGPSELVTSVWLIDLDCRCEISAAIIGDR